MWLARGPSRCDRGEHWRRSRTEQSRAEQSRAEQSRTGPVVVEEKTERVDPA